MLQTTVADVDDDLQRALADATARGADAVITSGGVSAGAYEVVRTAIADMTFTQVAMQPGKPQGFAAGHPLVFGLPGNPVSAAVSFEAFVRPALLAMQGRARLHRRMLRLPAAQGWRRAARAPAVSSDQLRRGRCRPGRRRAVPTWPVGSLAPRATR